MNNELKALQNLEQALNSKKEVLQSCIQEWEGVIQALEDVEKARLSDTKERIEKAKLYDLEEKADKAKENKGLEKFKKELMDAASAAEQIKNEKLELSELIKQAKKDRQIKKEKCFGVSEYLCPKDGDPITSKWFKIFQDHALKGK